MRPPTWRHLAAVLARVLVVAMGLVMGVSMGTAALAALPGDPMARRALACTGCHGEQGRAGRDAYYPRLAGKPAAYLYEQLLAFRDGRRRYALMTHLLEPLSEPYLQAFADHFAGLDLPYGPPAPEPSEPGLKARARQLVMDGDPARRLPACVACHGQRLTGVLPAVPSLLGLPRDYLNAQLGAWRSGTRSARAPDCMAEIAQRLQREDVAALSTWLAAQPVPTASHAADALPKALPLRCGGEPARVQP
jgi:cytochrome c553